jgi:hypothetical protein
MHTGHHTEHHTEHTHHTDETIIEMKYFIENEENINHPHDEYFLTIKEMQTIDTDITDDVVIDIPFEFEKNTELSIYKDPLYLAATNKLERVSFTFILFIKHFIAGIGGVIFWVGTWNALDVYIFPPSFYVEIASLAFGLIMYMWMIFLCEIPSVKALMLDKKTWRAWAVRTFRDILATYLGLIVWKSTYNIFDIYLLVLCFFF